MPAVSELLGLVLLALLPAFGSIAGAAVAEWKAPPEWLTGAALHAAAGLATGVVAVELMPRALADAATWQLAIAFMAGAVASIGLMRLTQWLRVRFGSTGRRGLWSVYAVVGADLLIDGLTTGAGSAASSGLGLLIALSQVVANLPGGFAVTANFRSAGVSRTRRLAAASLFPLPSLLGAIVGFLALRQASAAVTAVALAFFGGLLLLATIEEMIPAADRPGAPLGISSPAFAGGFVTLMLLSAYLPA